MKEDKLKALVTELYNEKEILIEPTYPRVLVRVLPREQKVGSIIVPEHNQNKPTLEGIVLAIFKPFYRHFRRDKGVHEEVLVECSVKVGDHILAPHMALGITPVWPLDGGKGDYRLIPDDLLMARLRPQGASTIVWLGKELHYSTDQALDLLEKAIVIRKDLHSRTLSGA